MENKFLKFCGMFVLPLIAAVPLLLFGITKYNYTGILNITGLRPYAIAGGLFYGLILFLLLQKIHPAKVNKRFLFFWFLGIITPYAKGSLLGQCHLLFALVGTIILQFCIYPLWYKNHTITQCYFASCFLTFLIIITSNAITGPAELAYAVPLPILLSLLCK